MRPHLLSNFIVKNLSFFSRFKEKLNVSPHFLLAILLLWILEPTLLLPAFFSVLVHEAGHILALKCVKSSINSLNFTLFGAVLTPSRPLSYLQECFVGGAGPGFSVGFALVCCHFHRYLLAGMSFSLGFCNLLPIFPLDGGRVLGGLAGYFLGPTRGPMVVRWVGVGGSLLILGVGFHLFLVYGGLTLPLLSLWLIWHNFNQNQD